MGLREDPACWRCNETAGTLTHMLWSCPKAQSWWTAIYENLKLAVGQDFPFTPSLFILGESTSLKGFSEPEARWILTAIMLGRKLLVREWKARDLPWPSCWSTQLSVVAAYEEMTYRLQNRLDAYYAKWGKYISLVTR